MVGMLLQKNLWEWIYFYITRDGENHPSRSPETVGAHCKNHNRYSLGICYEGGLTTGGVPADTRTPLQKTSLVTLLRQVRKFHSRALILGHHDLEPMKACPCFDAAREYETQF